MTKLSEILNEHCPDLTEKTLKLAKMFKAQEITILDKDKIVLVIKKKI